MPLIHTVPAVFIQFLHLSRSAPLYHAQEVRETYFPYRRATGHVLKVGKLGVVLGQWSGEYSDDLLEALGGEDLGEWRPDDGGEWGGDDVFPAGSGPDDPAQPEAAAGEDPAPGDARYVRAPGPAPSIPPGSMPEPDWDLFD